MHVWTDVSVAIGPWDQRKTVAAVWTQWTQLDTCFDRFGDLVNQAPYPPIQVFQVPEIALVALAIDPSWT